MKEKRTYRRFDLLAFLAILGCIGMLLFECVFIFELYDRTPLQTAGALPVQAAPALAVSAATNAAPAVPVEPVEVPPAVIEQAPVIVPAG